MGTQQIISVTGLALTTTRKIVQITGFPILSNVSLLHAEMTLVTGAIADGTITLGLAYDAACDFPVAQEEITVIAGSTATSAGAAALPCFPAPRSGIFYAIYFCNATLASAGLNINITFNETQ